MLVLALITTGNNTDGQVMSSEKSEKPSLGLGNSEYTLEREKLNQVKNDISNALVDKYIRGHQPLDDEELRLVVEEAGIKIENILWQAAKILHDEYTEKMSILVQIAEDLGQNE